MHLPPVQHRSVLITGCSSGIGLAAAILLRRRGWRVMASARKPADVERLAGLGFEALMLDVADEASVAAAVARTLDAFEGRLGALVNNAGYSESGALEDLARDALRRQFETNVFGLQDLTNRVLPSMLAQGWGRIVHISSVLGRVVIPLQGPYCASKHAVEALADAQRVELRGTGIGLSLVEPGPIVTEFRRHAATLASRLIGRPSAFARYYEEVLPRKLKSPTPRPFSRPPEAVAARIAHALESSRPRARYKVTLPAHVAPVARALTSDGFFDWFASRRLPRRS
jgi:NAD(P)-dependent dehydrogenase (short-subunit alcohol dehydrogenase family)